jgi:hypothetical protein
MKQTVKPNSRKNWPTTPFKNAMGPNTAITVSVVAITANVTSWVPSKAAWIGFVGAVMLVLLMFVFALRGFRIATRAPDTFGGLLIVGIVILIITQSFLNIGSMLGIMPLSGLPLIFVSQGGTALLFALASVGIILNISRYQKS